MTKKLKLTALTLAGTLMLLTNAYAFDWPTFGPPSDSSHIVTTKSDFIPY
jgi:hypothetical protein